jgi:hypothetical protein
MNAVVRDLFGITPALRVRLDHPHKTCCDNVAVITPGKGPHAAELRCVGCDAHRAWLSKQAFDSILENSRRYGAPAEIVWRDRTVMIGDQTMATEKKFDNSGILFKNEDKNKDTDRDYQGSATIAGVEYWMSAWLKQGKRGKFMTFAFKPKDEAKASGAAATRSDEAPFSPEWRA